MAPTTLVLAALALTSSGDGPASQLQTPDAQAILRLAVEAASAVRTATYDARVQISIGGDLRRIITGQVDLVKFDYSDPVGGKLAVRGEAVRTDTTQVEPFHAVYDGETVSRLVPAKNLLLQTDLHYGGEGLLWSIGKELILRDLLAEEPFAAQREAPRITYAGREEIEGVPCDVVEVQYDKPHSSARWYFSADDHLPRRHLREYRSARGNEVTSVLTLGRLRTNTAIDDSIFTIQLPEGYAQKTVGYKPPKPITVGDVAPDWTLVDEDGREYSLSDYRGQVVVLDFFATWCTFCQRAMPAIQKLHDDYADRGVALFSLSCRERDADADPPQFVRSRGFTYPVLDGNTLAPQYQVRGIPAFYLIGPNGRLVYSGSGFSEERHQRLIDAIERQLSQIGGSSGN